MSTDQARTTWRTSSYSAEQGNCVEVAPEGADVWRVRDTKDRDGGEFAVSAAQWRAFLDGVC